MVLEAVWDGYGYRTTTTTYLKIFNQMQNLYRIGWIGLLALLALRVGIGWHFFKEGTDKIKAGTFSSEGFLKAAQGRLAHLYHAMVWDYDGSIRLDSRQMLQTLEQAAEQASSKFGYTDQQKEASAKLTKQYQQILQDSYSEHSQAIMKHQKGDERVNKMSSSALWNEVASLRGQKEKVAKERVSEAWPAIHAVDGALKEFEIGLNEIATPEQRGSSTFRLKRPGEGLLTSRMVDRIIPLFDVTVGVLLILGLLTRIAAVAAAAFLISVILSQFPGDPNTTPTYLYAVEALALLALAGLGAGRIAGLDFIPWAIRQRKSTAA